MTRWSDRSWLITGASAGFGDALAREVLTRGGRVFATARDVRTLSPLIEIGGDRLIALPLDVTVSAMIGDAIAKADASAVLTFSLIMRATDCSAVSRTAATSKSVRSSKPIFSGLPH